MREIKFRAWGRFADDKKDRMRGNWQKSALVEYLGFDGGGCFTLMQYTGLKDKNGKEIYEGDVLSCVKSKNTYQIEWCEESGAYYMQGINPSWGGFYFSNDKLEIYDDDFEIIGNIYENPELLEGN